MGRVFVEGVGLFLEGVGVFVDGVGVFVGCFWAVFRRC